VHFDRGLGLWLMAIPRWISTAYHAQLSSRSSLRSQGTGRLARCFLRCVGSVADWERAASEPERKRPLAGARGCLAVSIRPPTVPLWTRINARLSHSAGRFAHGAIPGEEAVISHRHQLKG